MTTVTLQISADEVTAMVNALNQRANVLANDPATVNEAWALRSLAANLVRAKARSSSNWNAARSEKYEQRAGC